MDDTENTLVYNTALKKMSHVICAKKVLLDCDLVMASPATHFDSRWRQTFSNSSICDSSIC